ncbi:SDR family NAD(P)-dependent oxidoreductase [Bordetella sp. BOR01]|uniref:SDR family NAD(P)-dependent oxidoreductase n=1 Tax=Bordetella sp. BOR01 TaxID=2854779 RepID=UPI001C44267A|nr:SDR family NAD(P)-dependent oxidoreductase [Bordetella sp. BOR01]MBV7482791.1 SDR family oxidoreductase [Bordetella sp. BOR01]
MHADMNPGASAGRLAGRAALVTGAAGGIGSAAALRFAGEGAAVALLDRRTDVVEQLAGRIVGAGGQAIALAADVTDDDGVRQAVARAVEAFGKIDLLFNCAGGSVAGDTAVEKIDLALWDRTLQLDLNGTMLCCRHAVPVIVQAGGGTVVNMSSGAGLRGTFAGHAYTAAKGAVIALTRALAAEYAPHGVRVNAICAGRIRTERILRNLDAGRPARPEVAARYPCHEGDPADIANIALFLASDESRMITGEAIAANGGYAAF